MTSDSEVPKTDDGRSVAVTAAWTRRMALSSQLRRDPEYRDAMVSPVLQPHLPPVWDPADRPSQRHRTRDCEREAAADRTKKSASGRAEHCCCGNRRPLTAAGDPDGDWIGRNSAVMAPAAQDDDSAVAVRAGFWRRVLRLRHPGKESR
jgi:hypothetical protein